MTKRWQRNYLAGGIVSASLFVAQSVHAQGATPNDTVRLSLFEGERGLGYWAENFTPESFIARIVCESSGQVGIKLYLSRERVGDWFTQHDGNGGAVRARLVADGNVSEFWLSSLVVDFSWVATLEWAGVVVGTNDDWMWNFATAINVTIETAAFQIALSPADGDPDARAAFVEACLAR